MLNKVSVLALAGVSTRESNIAIVQASLRSMPLRRLPFGDWPELSAEDLLPVGSVEFVRAAMSHYGCALPHEIGFPECVRPWLNRSVIPARAGLLGRNNTIEFVKPREAIKLFTGFVYDPLGDVTPEVIAFEALPPETPVWVSDVVSWVSEWRYYVLRGEVIGAGRYDQDGADSAPEPDMSQVTQAIKAFELSGLAPVGYGIDFGVLDNGRTALVEINDGWALGYYTGTASAADYFSLLSARWAEITMKGQQ